jgi:sugar fermentation stimulation protein A
LVRGVLLGRHQRFLADVKLRSGERVIAHCVNSGRMEGLVRKGAAVWLLPASNPARKLPWTWAMMEIPGPFGRVRVGVDTILPNRLIKGMLEARALPGFRSSRRVRPEFPYVEGSRADFLVGPERGGHLIEVKNCHLVYPDGGAYFPDSHSERATKHLRELSAWVTSGGRATVIFCVQRDDARVVRPSDVHDPTFAATARDAQAQGVRFRALRCRPTLRGLVVLGSLPVDLRPYDVSALLPYRDALVSTSGWARYPAQNP